MRLEAGTTIQDSVLRAARAPAAEVRGGAAAVEVVRTFDPASQRDWCELVRDVVAAANSGGGTILVHGRPHPWNPASESHAVKSLDKDALILRIHEFTGSSFTNVVAHPVDRPDVHAVRIAVGPALLPIGFVKSGSYLEPGEPAKQVDVFHAGSFYFRHGDRSEPASEADLRVFVERLLRRVRRKWLRGIRRVIGAPTDELLLPGTSRADRLPTTTARLRSDLQPVRIVNDPNAPVLQPQDVDHLYPYRLRGVVDELNRRAGHRALTTYDIQAVRRQHRLDDRPDFVFHLLGTGRRYSPAMIDWLWNQWEHDPEFFRVARAADQQELRQRRTKPR
jgi:hypothetical protein